MVMAEAADPTFSVQNDCEILCKAIKGSSSVDKAALIDVLCKRSWQQRLEIARTYRQVYGKDFEQQIDADLETMSSNLGKVLKRLLKTPDELAAYELHNAIESFGTDEGCLVEIICSKSNQELTQLKAVYQQRYGTTLEQEICSVTSGHLRPLLISLLSANRPADDDGGRPVDMSSAAVDARALYEACEEQILEIDEAGFQVILCGRSYSQLRAIFNLYATVYNKDIADAVSSNFFGDSEKAVLTIVSVARNKAAYFANRLHSSMTTGFDTNDKKLMRIIVGHCDFDLGDIKQEYLRLYDKALSQAVREATSGYYRNALLTLIGD